MCSRSRNVRKDCFYECSFLGQFVCRVEIVGKDYERVVDRGQIAVRNEAGMDGRPHKAPGRMLSERNCDWPVKCNHAELYHW